MYYWLRQFPLNKPQYDLLQSWAAAPFTWEQNNRNTSLASRKSNHYQLDPSQMFSFDHPRPSVSVPLSKVYRRDWRVTVGSFSTFPNFLENSRTKASIRRKVDAAVPKKPLNLMRERRLADKKRQDNTLTLDKKGPLGKLRRRYIGDSGSRHSHARKHGTLFCERCEEQTRITKVRHKRGVSHSTRCIIEGVKIREASHGNFGLRYAFRFDLLWPDDPMDLQQESTVIIMYQAIQPPIERLWDPIRQPRQPWSLPSSYTQQQQNQRNQQNYPIITHVNNGQNNNQNNKNNRNNNNTNNNNNNNDNRRNTNNNNNNNNNGNKNNKNNRNNNNNNIPKYTVSPNRSNNSSGRLWDQSPSSSPTRNGNNNNNNNNQQSRNILIHAGDWQKPKRNQNQNQNQNQNPNPNRNRGRGRKRNRKGSPNQNNGGQNRQG